MSGMTSPERTPQPSEPSVSATDDTRFRGELDGLRAIAILIVVAYHAGIAGFDGGFVGVDVFFVISGYLITRNILTVIDRDHGLALVTFWARRIRRLVPALALMVIVTMGVSLLILSDFEVSRLAVEGRAAALYFSNVHFAGQAGGYFGADVSSSPFLHTWSLGVEEQFYVVWPVLITLFTWLLRARPQRLRRALSLLFVFVIALSFPLNLSLTDTGSTWAFYGLPSRAWQFAFAGLLATAPLPARVTGRVITSVGILLGLSLIAIATVGLSGSTPYPGSAALLPTIGALLVVAVGHHPDLGRPGFPTRLLRHPVAQWFGRLSYSWYLWHWPVMILAIAAIGRDTVGVRTAAVLGALPIASLAFHFFENPIRFRWRAIRTNGSTLAFGVAVTALAFASSAGAGFVAESGPKVPIDTQLTDRGFDFFPRCPEMNSTNSGFDYCTAGEPDAPAAIALVGDSKAATWFNVTADTFAGPNTRVVLGTTPGCPFMDIELRFDEVQPVSSDECRTRRGQEHEMIAEVGADYVLIAQANLYLDIAEVEFGGGPLSTDAQIATWASSFEQMIIDLRADGRIPIVILDNPALPADPATCLARRGAVEPCELSTAEATAIIAPLRAVELEIVDRLEIPHIDATGRLCDTVCHLGFDDYLVYVDTNHLSSKATLRFGDELAALFESLGLATR